LLPLLVVLLVEKEQQREKVAAFERKIERRRRREGPKCENEREGGATIFSRLDGGYCLDLI